MIHLLWARVVIHSLGWVFGIPYGFILFLPIQRGTFYYLPGIVRYRSTILNISTMSNWFDTTKSSYLSTFWEREVFIAKLCFTRDLEITTQIVED